jgi:uncharacterized protein (DUF1697 family)
LILQQWRHALLEAAIGDRFGIWASVVVLTADELAGVLAANPFADEPNPNLVHVLFMNTEPPNDLLERIAAAESAAAAKGSRDTAQAAGHALFLHTPDGYGNSDLAQSVFKIIATPARSKKHGLTATARNWATATKLLSLCQEKT